MSGCVVKLEAPIAALRRCLSWVDHFWQWWRRQLLAFVPNAWRDRFRSRIEVHVTEHAIQFKIVRPRHLPEQGSVQISDGAIEPRSLMNVLRRERARLPICLVLSPGAILSRTVQVPPSVVPSFGRLLSLEADRWTPYGFDEIVAAWQCISETGTSPADIEMRFIPRALVDEWTKTLAEFGLAPSSVVLGSSQNLQVQLAPPRRPFLSSSWLAPVAVMVAASILVLTDWIVTEREREEWQRRFAAEQREYAKQRDVERKIDGLVTASSHQASSEARKPRITLLSELAAHIPPTDWLTEMVARNDAITLRGYAAKPETLLKALEPLAKSREVTLQGELSFDAKVERQRFSVTFRAKGGSDE